MKKILLLIFIALHCKKPEIIESVNDIRVIRGTNIHLRSNPSTKSNSLGFLQGGNEVKILQTIKNTEQNSQNNDLWFKVSVYSGMLEKKEGYVFNKFVLNENETPFDLLSKKVKLEERLAYYIKLQKDFPEYERVELYGLSELIDYFKIQTQCLIDQKRKNFFFKDKKSLINHFHDILSNYNDEKFSSISSCSFIWYDAYQTDLLSYPFISYSDRNVLEEAVKDIDISSGDNENCYENPEKGKICFPIKEEDGNFFVSGFYFTK
ncbi:hypothetical protein LPTSP3_g31700 [Leptospira kobayashii]|uniref:SH3b domain-containing protein n=1 Tax=Leptospira kobayashii TaxID=1917830 RepID=A0ABN6KGA7_9LEPT|nr:SH3 domain-containing protein [Leptospira kobayashii]BDA80240.1 hypothetical protein LPTSP3_g31700 [Leptospira kobayashii]